MTLSYAKVCATLSMAHIDLNWADDQYLFTLVDIMEEYSKIGKKPEKKKVGASEIGKFVV